MSIIKGLTEKEVEDSRLKYGSNMLTPPKKESMLKLFLEKFTDPVIKILLVAAFLSLGISFVHNEFYETIGIFFAILLATGISFWFEMDANRKFDILNQVNDDTLIKVYRDGQIREVGKKDLVVGDVIVLETGEEIPADCELIESVQLSANESCLTGEPSIRKTHIEEEFKSDATYPSNHLLRGTTIIEGNALARIIRVGDATEFGKVARQATEKSGEITPLTKQLDRLAKLIGVVGFSLAAVTFAALFAKDVILGKLGGWGEVGLATAVILGVFVAMAKIWIPIVFDAMSLSGNKKQMPQAMEKRGWLHWILLGTMVFTAVALCGFPFGVNMFESEHWVSIEEAGKILQYFMISVTLIVVAVPEGLPMSVTLSLALSMRKMLKNNNLVRKMHACETMGATTVICTDKTGTLTQNQMNVSEMYVIDNDSMLDKAISVNTTANIDSSGKPLGNPTEGALLLWLKARGISYETLRTEIIAQIPFSSKLKMMATTIETGGKKYLFVKGAPEYVLMKCVGVDREAVEQKLLDFQNRAMRTLAFAMAEVDKIEDLDNISGLRLQAVAAISDPVRADVPAAVRDCQNAGIAIKIVTGDTPATAREIGRQIGLWIPDTDSPINEITGMEWEALSDAEAYERAAHLKIMSRARPTDKQRLVQLLQKRGEVVAVTGDGTNDAPALNFANVGLSMGTGTSVAKEASDITLLDDSFASIEKAVMWGRSVYLNIQRFVLFQLTINVAALTIVFIGSILGFELPLTVTQMLWVNLIMDTFAAGALASLPPDERVMRNKPRGVNEFIITPTMKRSIIGTGLLFVIFLMGLLYWFGADDDGLTRYDLSMFFTIFVMLQFWNMFNAKAYNSGRSALHSMHRCGGFLLVSLLIVIGQILIVSFGGDVFRVMPLSIGDWAMIIAGTSVVLWVGEVRRLFIKR